MSNLTLSSLDVLSLDQRTAPDDLFPSVVPGLGSEDDGGCEEEDLPEDQRDSPFCALYSFVIYTVFTGLLCIFGTLGNSLAFLVFRKDRLKTSTSFLFQSLSVIDTLMLLSVFPVYCVPQFVNFTGLYPTYMTRNYPFLLVHLLPFMFIAQTSTIWVTVLVGVNRYIAVCMPYQAIRLCTVQQAKKQLAIVLLFSTIYNTPKFFEGRLAGNETVICAVHTVLAEDQSYRIIYGNILYTIVICVLPLLVLTFLNIRLMSALKDVKRKRQEMQSPRQQQDNNVTLVLIVVVIVFSICQFPALLTQIFWTILGDEARFCGGFQFYFSRISNVLVITNSSVNFIIYCAFNNRFRRVLSYALRGKPYPPARKLGFGPTPPTATAPLHPPQPETRNVGPSTMSTSL